MSYFLHHSAFRLKALNPLLSIPIVSLGNILVKIAEAEIPDEEKDYLKEDAFSLGSVGIDRVAAVTYQSIYSTLSRSIQKSTSPIDVWFAALMLQHDAHVFADEKALFVLKRLTGFPSGRFHLPN